MSLADRLVRQVAIGGPMSLAAYMTACLHDPDDGYYASRPRLGPDGDFLTAPKVSQMFGELIGLWAAQVWALLGSPAPVRLIELGPGDGAMLADGLRAARRVPGFVDACEVWLIERSPPLRALQADRLAATGVAPRWASDPGAPDRRRSADHPAGQRVPRLPPGPPVGQGRRRSGRATNWGQRHRRAGVRPCSGDRGPDLRQVAAGSVIETSAEVARIGGEVGALIADCGGAALFIDYGREGGIGDTLQAVRDHTREDPLAHPGDADLTCRPDFAELLSHARRAGASTPPVVSQGAFLRSLGIEARAAALAAANPDQAQILGRQLGRLIDADQMGALFKVACLHSAGLSPPGF